MFLGCSASTELAQLTVVDQAGAPLTAYVAVVTAAGVSTELSCPCAAGVGLPEGTTVLVKANGYATALADSGGRVVLRRLFVATEADYATGYAADGVEAFRAAAYRVDTELGSSYAAKFYIEALDEAEPRVYVQNTRRHPIHLDFVVNVLGRPYTPAQFVERTYVRSDRTELAGTLTEYPQLTGEYGGAVALSFFPSDTLTPAHALLAHRLLEERLGFLERAGTARRLVYVPAGVDQEAALARDPALFAAGGAPALTHVQLHGAVELQALNKGVAYGTLRLITPEALETTVVGSTDILVLPRLPNDLPLVAGTITGELQTPLAHVNVAARSRGTPNLALPGAETDERVAPLLGKLVRFEVAKGTFTLAETTLAEAEAFWESQKREPTVPEHDDADVGLLDFADLLFSDSVRVGVKAANLAELHRALGDTAPDGFAIPFFAYHQFMSAGRPDEALCNGARADCGDEGRSPEVCDRAAALCRATASAAGSLYDYANRLIDDPEVTTDAVLREAALDGLRWCIHHLPVDPTFGATLDAKVASLVGSAKVRLRSSTNAEDLPTFSGAGLYESHSATAAGEKAASSRIREVWGSVWRWKAFEERRFWNIDHRAVRMGVAVHRSFPEEAANGVIITQNVADPLTEGMYVNLQAGEQPVTNPEGGATPEIFSIVPRPGGGVQAQVRRLSSLSPEASLLSPAEVEQLYVACDTARRHFAPFYGVNPASLALDIEFKFTLPDRALVLKQARPFAGGP